MEPVVQTPLSLEQVANIQVEQATNRKVYGDYRLVLSDNCQKFLRDVSLSSTVDGLLIVEAFYDNNVSSVESVGHWAGEACLVRINHNPDRESFDSELAHIGVAGDGAKWMCHRTADFFQAVYSTERWRNKFYSTFAILDSAFIETI